MAIVVAPGAVLEGRYVLRAPLGQGGMGTVWRAEHTKLKTEVAVKLVAPSLVSSAATLERFRREAQLAASLESPHVVRILDFGAEGDTPYIVMELLQGETLGARLVRRAALGSAETIRIASQIARGVGRAHQAGIVHCDLKPENIFLANIDGEEIVKVLDFGVAKATTLDPLTATGAVLGTLQYMSPEQLEGRRNVDLRTDLYALGIIVFECVCGRPVFTAESVGEIVRKICDGRLPTPSSIAEVPATFDEWFLRAVHHDPASRFATVREMSEALASALPRGPDVPIGTRGMEAAPRIGAAAIDSTVTNPPLSAKCEWHAGNDAAGYGVHRDARSRLLEIKRWGLWDVSLARRFKVDVLDACARMKGAPWASISFATKHPPQNPDVQKIQGETMAVAKSFGLVRAAMVVESALAALAVRRLAQESGMDVARIFTDEAEARTWLAQANLLDPRGGA